ncbi:MAG TPA: hypothetical protein VGH98_15405 [Gemmatimonadaceae bacterium]|jgi:hypothetical protein
MLDSPSLNTASGTPSRAAAGRLTETERQALRARTAQARAAASEAVSHYAVILATSRHRIDVLSRKRVEIVAIREMLQESVQRYASLLKTLDTPPERALRLVKETVVEHVPHPERAEETRALLETVVNWCIEAYYGSSPAA